MNFESKVGTIGSKRIGESALQFGAYAHRVDQRVNGVISEIDKTDEEKYHVMPIR